MFDRLKKWLSGEFRQTPMETVLSGEPFENIVRPWPVRYAKTIWSFYLKHWQFVWTISVAIAAIIVGAIFTAKYGNP